MITSPIPVGQSVFLMGYRAPRRAVVHSAGDPVVDITMNPATNSVTPAERAQITLAPAMPWGGIALAAVGLGIVGLGFYRSAVTGLGALALVSAGACAYHGTKRHHGSWGWGAWWGFMGAAFPVVTPVVAVAQGFAKPLPT